MHIYTECVKSIQACLALVLMLALPVWAQAQNSPARPRITGIDHVSFYTTQPDGAKALYGTTLGLTSAASIESGG